MSIRSITPVDVSRFYFRQNTNRVATNHSRNSSKIAESTIINLQDEISSASEEISDIFSVFGRFSKTGRRNDGAENDFVSSILEDKADEKLGTIVKNIHNLRNLAKFLTFSRSLFPNDSDLMLALRELLLSRQLSELQKKIIRESIHELEKFCDSGKMNSGINIGQLAKRFSNRKCGVPVSSKELRNSYLRFLELDIPASLIYQDWIDEFGCENRTRLLSFTLSALVADMKSNVPGIHFDEFGPLSSKLSDARMLHTLDQLLLEHFSNFSFYEKLKSTNGIIVDEGVIKLFMIGLTDSHAFEKELSYFHQQYMSELLIKQKATACQAFRNVYNVTPENLYIYPKCRLFIQDYMSSLMLSMHKKEMNNIHW
ncbi:HrpJ domain-containing protein [uncultured Cedecea sp.]|uniref:HrpJ domain-containing protein n=1 Tax=uncultured Cedecea sp. TaxID=988762 RepID=UPI0026114D4D|nr:HrpJ domain-containing protein [uncultured Cedecea sp.]